MYFRLGVIAVVLGCWAAVPASASAVGTCDTGVAWDYTRPLAAMPSLPEPPASGELPFAPGGPKLEGTGVDVELSTERTWVRGFSLDFQTTGPPGNGWRVTAKLAKVNARGEYRELLDFRRRRLPRQNTGDRFYFDMELESPPVGFYRTEIVFRDGRGKRLGRFAEYSRVVPPVGSVQMTLNASVFHPGQTIEACLENLGTTQVGWGCGDPQIQVLTNGAWEGAEEIDPPRSCTLELRLLRGGSSVLLDKYAIPEKAALGTYRAVEGFLIDEFQITPG